MELRPKIDKISNISVRDFPKVGCAKFPISSPVLKIFARNFQDARRSEFGPYVTIVHFDRIFAKNLAAKIQNLPDKFQNLAGQISEFGPTNSRCFGKINGFKMVRGLKFHCRSGCQGNM